MDMLRQWRFKLLGLFRDGAREAEMLEEMRAHLERLEATNRDAGMPPNEARDRARRQFGNVPSIQASGRDQWRFRWVDDFRTDLVFALRQLRASPAFALVAVVTLALGIGANSAMFALADATLLRPLPYADPDRLVMIWERSPTRPYVSASPLALLDWQTQSASFDALAGIGIGIGSGPIVTAPDGSMESAERQQVTSGFFAVLGVIPIAGRTFQASDEGPSPSAVVFSEALWRSRFGGDPRHIGGAVRLNGQPFTLVGVIPDSVRFTRPASMWTLIPQSSEAASRRGARFLEVVGRLKKDVTLDSARADLSVIAERTARDFPATNAGWSVALEPLRLGLTGPELQLTSIVLLAVVGFVLLLCCANVANLLLARAVARGREVALRAALGAGRGRIVRQLLTESLVLAALGGACGLALGTAILEAAPSVIPAGLLPPAVVLTFDARVAIFSIAAALVVGMLFGLVPAWQAARTSLTQVIASDSRSTTQGVGRFRSVVVVGEVAAAAILLCGAGLLVRTMHVLGNFDPGYRADGDSILTLDFSVGGARYATPESLLQFYDAVERDVRALPGIRSAGFSSSLPYGTSELGRRVFDVVGEPADIDAQDADTAVATPGYFHSLDIAVVAGRGFSEHDSATSAPVCVVNESVVRRYFAGRNPIGARIVARTTPPTRPSVAREIVGVVRQTRGRPDDPQDLMQVTAPLAQSPISDTFLVIQPHTGRPESLVPAIREVVARHDPNVPVRRIRTLGELLEQGTARYRFRAAAVTTFAGLALVLAMVGVFGVLAYSVEQRSRELGLRMALGATARNVLALVLGSAARVILAGVAIGLAAAAMLARSIAVFLYGVQPLDPVTFGSVVVVLAVTAGLATAAPALRALRLDPVVTMRSE
jgi:putative ABC transport system permease protein